MPRVMRYSTCILGADGGTCMSCGMPAFYRVGNLGSSQIGRGGRNFFSLLCVRVPRARRSAGHLQSASGAIPHIRPPMGLFCPLEVGRIAAFA